MSASRIIQAYQVLNQVLKYAIRMDRQAINPAADIELPRKTDPDQKFLPHAEVAVLAEEADRFRVLMLVLAYCGVRVGEATALRVSHGDIKAGRLNVARFDTYVDGKGIVEGADEES